MTARYALFGDPVSHSLSPAFQNAALKAAGLDAEYVAMRVTREELPAAIAKIRAGELAGANVTIPWKREAMPLCDVLTEEAREVGAVNWLGLRDGRLVGDNFDARGLLRSMEAAGVPLAKKDAVVIGTGGGARAAIVACLRAGARVWVCGRNRGERAAIAEQFAGRLMAVEAMNRLPKRERDSAVVVSTVPPAAWGEVAPVIARLDAWIVDLAYAPGGTPAEQWAAGRKLKSLGGLGMLLEQGALSFEAWTGRPFPQDAARAALEAAAAGRERP